MAQDNIKNLYDALKGDYDLGSEQDFRNSLKDANNRRNLYKAISGSYDLGSEQDFDRSLGYGQSESKQTAGEAAQQVIDEYDRSDKMTDTEREDMADWAAGLRHDVKTSTRQASNKIRYSQELARNPLRINRNNVGTDTNPMQFGENPNVVETGKRYDNESGKFKPVYITETGNEYINRLEADREQNRIDKEKREEEQRKREEEAKMQHDPTLWETVKKSLGAGFMRVGAGLLDTMQSLTSGMIVEDPSSPAGYTRTRSYEEALSDKNDPLTTASSYLHGTADRMSEEAQPHSGRKGFLDMLWDGEIGGFLQKGIATAGESLPMTLSAFNPYTMTLNAISMAGSNYRENTLANPDIPALKRAAQAVGSAAIEQAVEKYSDPIFKYVGGGKILRGASKNASEKITNDITGKATETLAKRIYGRLKGIGKDALGEGAEEIIGNAGNDILGETLDIVDGNEDYGLRAQWKEMKKENPDADLTDFSKAKAKEYVESFIGGAMAGAYTSGTAHLSTKAIQYSFDRLGNGSVEENEGKPLNPVNVDLAQSFDDGYSEEETTELQDTKNLYELRQNQMAAMFGVDAGQVDETIGDPVNFIGELQRLERNDEIQPVLDYINAKAKFDGMIQRVRDDIDGRIEQSNKMVNERTNHETGMIQGATLKVQDTDGNDRRAYILSGNLVMLPDGTGVDREKSGNSILILHEDTNEMEMVSPDAIFSIEQPVDPEMEKQTAAEAIRQQFAQEAANKIDGTVTFQPGDTYTVTDESGQPAQIQIVPNEDGFVDNGDGTVNVSSDGGQTVVPMRKEDIQAMVDATNRARVAQVEQQREAMQQPQAQEQPAYSLNDEVTLLDENGNEVRGNITADVNEDGQYEVYTESPINGRKVNLFTAEELNRLQANPAGNSRQNGGIFTENGRNSAENSHQENIATVNQDAINNATVDDLLKADSSRVESYYREHPEEVAEALATPAQATADYINGKLTDRDYLIALGYSTGENSWLDSSATDEEIAETVAENRGKYLPYVTMPQVQQPSNEPSNAQEQPVQTEQPGQSAMERIPKDEQGQPVYEQADPDTAWDAIVEQAEGDESMAQSVADSMVADKEAELKKVEKTKPKGGTTIAEKIAAERERKNAVEQAKANLALWQRIAQTSQRRRQAAMAEQSRQAAEAARLRREQEEQERAAREEAERIRREALNGVPDFVDDTPQDARARGYRRVNGEKVDRQQSIPARQGREVQVKFDDKNIPTGHVALIEASQLQPSHLNGLRNPLHFIDEAQPKERNDDASVMSARRIAANIRPEEITSSVTAYTGAPTVNTRGEVIQGNNRSAALREMWAGEPEQSAIYKQYLADHAADFGLAPEDVEAMQQPVLVNMLDVPDEDAITLGQFVAQDTESGGVERIKPKNIVQKMGDDMRSFAGRLLASPDEEMTFSELVDRNGMDVLKWMQAKNYITPTQYRSAFDSKGNLTGEAKNDLKGIMYQSIFQNGNTHLEEMFGALPAKAQKAILATAYRDYDSPNTERLNTELQNSISAYYALSQMPDFANAKNYKEARLAVEARKRQYALDDVTGESYLPSERYSNFALLLATMYKGQTQTFIQNTFNHIYDLVQGTQEATLFEEPDNTPRTLVEAINETLSGLSEELLLNGNFIYNGQRRNNVLAGSGTTGQPRGQGSPGSSQTGGRIEDGTETSNSSDRAANDKSGGRSERNGGENQGTEKEEPAKGQLTKAEAAEIIADMEEHAEVAPEIELTIENWDALFGEDGRVNTPLGEVKMGENQFTKLMRQGRNGKLGMVKPTLENPDIIIEDESQARDGDNTERPSSYVFVKTFLKGDGSRYYYFTSITVSKEGREVVVSSQEKSRNRILRLMLEGSVIWRTPKDATTSSAEKQGLDYAHPNEAEDATKGSGITPQSTSSAHKDTEKSAVTQTIGEKVAQAEAETEQNPTEAQKEAGNYKKGHVRIGQFDITVENPKGSVRRGTDQNGNSWETTMHNTYGYIRGTEGVDGDHIDVFLTDDIDGWNGRRVYVVDQYNEDGTFDEHKVMLGFNDEDDARNAYLSNYSEDWANNRKIVMTSTNLEDFEKWIDSSHRKTKPFAEYKSVQNTDVRPVSGYNIEQRYHKKKDTYIYAVKFTEQMPREQFLSLKKRVKDFGGYYSSYGKGGFIFETEEAGRKFAEAVLDPSGEKLDDNKPLSLADMQQSSEPVMRQVDVEGLMQAINESGEAKLSDHFVVGRPGLTERATSRQTENQTQETEQQPQQSDNNGYGANNKLVSRDRYEELKKRMRQKLGGQLNMGIDPEILAIGTEMAAFHIEAGARKFADYARHMIDDLGDAIRPYLKSFYNGVRDLPEVQEAGYVDEMTPYDEVRTFDVANFDKAQGDALATAEMVMAEQEAQAVATAAKEQLTNQRNEQRRQEDEQRTADTETVADEAEAVASQAESDIEAATDEKQVNEAIGRIDAQLDKVNEQLALLGYYEAEQVESDFNEAYGYMRNAEKKAVKDANNLAKRLVNDLGIDPKTIVDSKGKRRRSIAKANIAPIGGDISIHLPLGEKRELYISIQLDNQDGDNLKVTGGMLRIENPNPERGEERYLSFNNLFAEDETYPSLLRMVQQLVKRYAPDFVPVSNAQQEASTKSGKKSAKRQKKQDESKIADLFSGQEETVSENQEDMPFKKGDNVIYNGKPATVYDIEKNGRLVLDTGLAPVLYESADPKEVKPANTATHNAENTEINRIFANAVKTDMLAALDSGTKPYRSILDLRKRAAGLGMEVDNDGRTDILLQELVEDGLVRAAREVVNKHGRDRRESYDLICKLYDMQPTIAARSSNRIKMQQYSTPLPMAWNAAHFAMSGKKDGKVLEPTAGNGMLVFAVPANQVHVNELDETRLDNLREQGFAEVTQQDAVEPFEGGKQYDVVIANPPFGKREAVNYDGKLIPGLDPQITLNALASMKDDGKAAIIIGGNMEYGSNGGLKSMKPFFTYLYDHYNVKGVVDMDGKLYAKQGTTYPTRMILIDGRRSDEERAQSAVYPPVQSKAIRKADSFETLYDIIDEVINSNEKTNGTEILRSQQGQLVSVADQPSRNADGKRHTEQSRKDDTGRRGNTPERSPEQSENVLRGKHRENTGNGEAASTSNGSEQGGSRRSNEPDVQRVGTERVSTDRVGLNTEQKKRTLTEEKLPYRPHNTAFSLNSVAPAAMVEAMDNILKQIEAENGDIDEYIRKELGYDTIEEAHQALAAEQMDSVAMAIYQMKKGQALIIGDQTGVGKGRQMAALIRWAVMRGEKPVFITQKADLFSDIYRDLVDIGSGDLVPFIFNSDGAMVDSNGNVVHKPLSSSQMAKVFASGQLPEDCDFAVLTYSQVNTGDAISQKELEEAAKKHGGRVKKSKASKDGKATPKATFLRSIAEDNYLFLDESHTAAGTSNTGAYLQSILRSAKAATFASATFAKRPDTMPLYAIRTAMSQAKVEPDKMISIIEKGGVTLQEIMSRELTNAGQMVRRERDMSDVKTDWKTIDDPATVKRARENYDRTIAAFNAIIKFQDDYVKPKIDELDKELAITAESAGIKRGTDKMGVENVPFASKTYNYTKQLMLALKVDAIADEVDAEIKAGRHPVIALESTMESTIKDYAAGDIIEEPTFSASLLKGLDTVMQYTVKDENGKETHAYYSPHQLGEAGEKAYYELQDFIRKSTSDIFISPLDAIIERLHEKGYKVGELTGRNMYVERNDKGQVVVKRRTDKDKKKMQREFNNGTLDVLILNKSASTGISLHASEKFSDQRQRTMIIAQPLSDINDYMQMIGRIDRTGQVHRGYYINLGLPVPAENRFLMMLSTKLKSLNANTTTSQDSKSNEVEAPDLLNKYGSQVVVEYLRDNPEIYEKMGCPLKKGGLGGGRVQTKELDEYKPQEDDARKITGYVALLSTKEQEEFYDDVVRRYNELIKYLDDTGSNDLKITVMPLRAKTLEKRISSEGIDPDGKNPFAQNAYVEKVEMDVLRKPMKADEIRKTVEQINGKHPETHLQTIIETIQKEHNDKIAAEEQRYENSKKKAVESIAKQTEKINRQQKRTADEKREAIATITQEINDSVEERHDEALKRLNSNRDLLLGRLRMFSTSSSYLVPDNLETMMFDFAAPAIFCGYKAKDKKITASTTLAVFATLDGRRRIEVKLSDTPALQSIYKMTNDNWDAARSITLENWDSQIPNETRKQGYILTGNILQAIADTQDEHGSYPGQLISYTDIDGNIHDGILMPDKWNTSMLKSAGAPLSARMEQIRQYKPIVSLDGKVSLVGSEWAQIYYLTVPKTKKDGAVYYENETLLNAANGIFYPFHGELRADIPAKNIGEVVRELTKLGVKVKESNDVVADDISINEEEANDLYRIVDDESEIERLNSEPTVKVYRAMSLVDGKLYPPMSKKIGTGSNRVSQAPSEFGQWEVSDERPHLVEREGAHKNHIYIVKDNGKGLWVAYNPYFHTSRNPLNDQFAEAYKRPNLVTVEVEIPESELTSGYQAEGAKDPVGETKWNAGPVNRQLSGDKKRKVILSRWMRPVRIVPDSEVAQRISELIEGENVAIPDNTVTPSLLEELKKLGVKIVDGINKGRKKASAMMRGGNGTLTDDELSYENDQVAKMTGRSPRTAAQRRAFAERERQRMVQRVQELAEKLHLDNVDIVTDASTLQGRRAKAKGFYSRSTGRITIVIPNHASVYDAEQTLLHEAVAHYGLRQLFGEHFDTFLDNVFQNAEKGIQERIAQIEERLYQADIEERTKRKGGGVFARAEAVTEANTKRRNGDYRKAATEEYLASLAESTNFDNMNASWWQKIKELFLRMLHKIGFEDFSGVTLSDNELRYILWRSYENLAEPGRYRSILGEAEDVAKQNELKVGNYATDNDGTARNVAEQDELYRDGDPEVHERVLARDRYEQRVRRGMYQMQEALQDSMLGLREAMGAILKGEGKKKVRIEDVDGFENAYLGENRLSSVNKAEADAFAHTLFKPLLDEVGKLAPNKEAREELTDYMMAKHGLERNRVMREREKEKLIADSELTKSKPQQPSIDDDDYDLKMDAFDKAMEDWEKQVEEELEDKFKAIDKRDFAGLTALTEADNVADAETEAAAMVDAYESGHDTEALWKRTNDVSNAILSKLYETGMMSKDTYDNVRSMYEYYIPLRGFDEKTSDEAYAYLNSKNSAFNAPIKKAKGRKSKADDPLAYLQSMAESAIMQGNRNKLVKQKFLNFVLNHPSDLASVSDIWLKYDEVAEEWQPVFPDNINADDTPAEVERKMQDFEDKMKELAKQDPDLYKHGKDTVNIPYRVVEKRDLRQHQVVVKRGGRDYVITINGNPRAAQALNGQTNPDNDMSGAIGVILKAGERINRELSALYTTRNPDFVVSNFIRDMLYSNSMMWVKESPNYALRYHRNFAKVNPVRMKMLLAKHRNGTLDMNNETERLFHQFMMNGGETGYANMRDIEKHKNDIRREIRKAGGQLPIRRAWDLLTERLDEVNRGVENCARFAAFMTSREIGRTIDRSIYDAKEISVNFNKKGSGAKFMSTTGQTKLGNASAFMSGLGRSGFVFWNAAIQGTANFGRQASRHPAKAMTSIAVMFLLGAVVASLGYGDDDEDDKNSYWNLPEYVRRSNLLFKAGDQWISIPLPVEYRAVYGLGELMVSTMSGKEHLTDGEIANAIAGQVSQLLPLDFLEGGGGMKAFIPSAIKPFAEAYGYKKSWTGLPIYKDTPFNKDMPEWTKAYKSANKYLVDLSETLNELSGGDRYTKGTIDINPAKVEYVLNGYFGGIANTIDRLTKMGETMIGQREYDPKSFLVLNRILKNGDERTEYKAVNNEYFRLKEEHDKLRTRLRNYERDTDNGIFDYAEKIDFLYNSPEYERYEIFESYRPDIDDLYNMLKEANSYGDKEEIKDIEAELNELKKMMISDMNKTRK